MNERILGLDQSLVETGYFFDINNYGTIKTKSKGTERLVEIRDKLKTIIESVKPTVIVMENYSFGTKGRAFPMGELGGTIKVLCHDLNIKLIIILPSHLKKFMTSKGNSEKSLMLLSVYKNYNFETDNDNIADAFSLNKFYEEYLEWKNGKSFPDYKIDCFKKVDANENM